MFRCWLGRSSELFETFFGACVTAEKGDLEYSWMILQAVRHDVFRLLSRFSLFSIDFSGRLLLLDSTTIISKDKKKAGPILHKLVCLR